MYVATAQPEAPLSTIKANANANTKNVHLHWTKRTPAPMDPQVKNHNGQMFYWCRKCQLWNTAHGTKQHFGPGIGVSKKKSAAAMSASY